MEPLALLSSMFNTLSCTGPQTPKPTNVRSLACAFIVHTHIWAHVFMLHMPLLLFFTVIVDTCRLWWWWSSSCSFRSDYCCSLIDLWQLFFLPVDFLSWLLVLMVDTSSHVAPFHGSTIICLTLSWIQSTPAAVWRARFPLKIQSYPSISPSRRSFQLSDVKVDFGIRCRIR